MATINRVCPPHSKCGPRADHEFGDELFRDNWEVFVIRHDEQTGTFDWFTECCERIVNKFANGKQSQLRSR